MEAAVKPGEVEQRFDTTGANRLYGRWLAAARALWSAVITAMVVALALAIPHLISASFAVSSEFTEAAARLGINPLAIGIFELVLGLLTMAIYLSVSLVLFFRRSDDWMVMLTSVMLATFGGSTISGLMIYMPNTQPALQLMFDVLAGIGNATFVVFLFTFPNGQFIPRWTKYVASVGALFFMLLGLLASRLQISQGETRLIEIVIFGISLAFYLTSVFTQRYRFAQPENRGQWQQGKWIMIGLVGALIGYLWQTLPGALFPALPEMDTLYLLYRMSASFISKLTLMLVPVTIGLSITRYRLWDVDFIINRGLVYGGLTVFLIVFFLLDLFAVQRLFIAHSGQEQANIAIAIVAVISGMAFQPLRRRLQRFVDRQFYGIRLDYQKTDLPAARGFANSVQLAPGSAIGPYQLVEVVGRGGMAEVYKGIHPTLGRTVAVKVMLADRAHDPDFRARFEREAKAIAVLDHTNIVEIFDYGQVEDTAYMVMEYIDGLSLSDYIRQNERMLLEDALPLLGDIAGALDYAHQLGFIHRDIKPSNVMLRFDTTASSGEPRYHAVLTDFGITKMLGRSTALTRTGMVGTLDYIAPEQIQDAKEVDGRADVYSLGIMTYEMLTGQLPFRGSNPGAILIAHLQSIPIDPRKITPGIPPEASDAVMQALAKNPAARFLTAGEFVAALSGGLLGWDEE